MTKVRSVVTLAAALLIACAGPAVAEHVLRWASAGGAATFDPDSLDSGADARHHGPQCIIGARLYGSARRGALNGALSGAVRGDNPRDGWLADVIEARHLGARLAP